MTNGRPRANGKRKRQRFRNDYFIAAEKHNKEAKVKIKADWGLINNIHNSFFSGIDLDYIPSRGWI